jgi:photosystem II stability/assembly factor-like uncharacterized protein
MLPDCIMQSGFFVFGREAYIYPTQMYAAMSIAFFRRFLPAFLLLLTHVLSAQPYSPELLGHLQWRMIGPHRGGRTVGAVGVPQQPNVFYIGVNNGGVWKTDDFGRTWNPIFDDQPTGSIGDVAVAPSNPDILYAASGEGIQRPDLSVGDGVYKSTNAGKTWTNMGLREGLQIGGLAIDPNNPDRVFAAVMGHPYGPNAERGVFRTTDGGKTWSKVLFINENTGAAQVVIDPKNPDIIYADLFESRLAPWENGRWYGENGGMFKSTDGGNTWKRLLSGLPEPKDCGRIGFCIAPSQPARLYATVESSKQGGIYRSDDAGETWRLMNPDERLWGRGDDFAEIKADPKNPDIVYSANVVTWKSTDGGKQWSAFRGAPGGDDYHRIWINPDNPNIILLASDQGAIITVNGGKTFSSWYNQPTAQFYHVSADNAFPYNVYGGQQESGSVGIASRGNDGAITFREWHPVGGEEYGYVAADPLDPNIVYGGKISRFDKRTGQVQNVSPEAVRSGQYRFIRTAPILFSPIDPHVLYFAGNVLFKTRNGGNSWDVISPDLTRATYNELPECIGIYRNEDMKKMARRGVIYAIAPSPLDSNIIWAGTDDGLLHVTRNGGKAWKNITPPKLAPWSKISMLEASHSDPNTAYAAVNCIRLDDLKPHILRTSDGGATWKEITTGLPDEPVNTVREDPFKPGLLYAGTERAVYVSFDDGAHWQSLRRNMPATSIRDLIVKDDDLVVGTHGRSFWILDNVSALRQLTAAVPSQKAVLFAPAKSYRVRWSMYTDTPLPQEEPAGQNPPDGAMLEYYLKTAAAGPVTLDILDAAGKKVRHYASDDKPYDLPALNIPLYWVRPQQILSDRAGMHRFCWDMRYDPLGNAPSFPISAVYGNTAPDPTAPFVMSGTYTAVLTVDGQTYRQNLEILMDPRVKTSKSDLQAQHDNALVCYDLSKKIREALTEMRLLRTRLRATADDVTAEAIPLLKSMYYNIAKLESSPRGSNEPSFGALQGSCDGLLGILIDCDRAPTQQALDGLKTLQTKAASLFDQWNMLKTSALPQVNRELELHKLKQVDLSPAVPFAPPTTHPAADEAGWTPLLKADLSDATFPKGIWSVQNGELTATEDQCIWTQRQYQDFVLDLEFKTADGTNSGVIVHCSDTEDWIPNSVEIQIADDYSKEWSSAPGTWQCGAVFGHLAASQHTVKKPGEWNHYTITCKGREIWVLLNGVQVNYMNMNLWLSGALNPDGSEIPSWLYKPFAAIPLQGHIGFQGKHAGAPIWFRNIRIRELR